MEDVITDLRNTRNFQARYSEIFDNTEKDHFAKVYDHDTAAIMERVLFDRLYDEVTAIDKLFNELFAFATLNKNKPCNYPTAADMVRGKAAANVNK